ncbi:A24 family peptidase [Mycobacterium sp. IDR2000157661]|nr:A24 family peptidase [Mycobacterium sp. IDR2000157661]
MLSVYDICLRRLPNALTLPGAAVVLIAAVVAGRGLPAVLGALLLFGGYLLVHVLAPGSMGAGDVKLALGVGALTGALGTDIWAVAALAAPVGSALWAFISVGRGVKTTVPHGFSMCLATAVAGVMAIG